MGRDSATLRVDETWAFYHCVFLPITSTMPLLLNLRSPASFSSFFLLPTLLFFSCLLFLSFYVCRSCYRYMPGIVIPPVSGSWIVWDVQFGSLPDLTPVAVVGFISGDVLTVRVVGFNTKTGAIVTDWSTPRATDGLQNNPSIRCATQYVGLALWGDSDKDRKSVV